MKDEDMFNSKTGLITFNNHQSKITNPYVVAPPQLLPAPAVHP